MVKRFQPITVSQCALLFNLLAEGSLLRCNSGAPRLVDDRVRKSVKAIDDSSKLTFLGL